jgi:hypothetical protein
MFCLSPVAQPMAGASWRLDRRPVPVLLPVSSPPGRGRRLGRGRARPDPGVIVGRYRSWPLPLVVTVALAVIVAVLDALADCLVMWTRSPARSSPGVVALAVAVAGVVVVAGAGARAVVAVVVLDQIPA